MIKQRIAKVAPRASLKRSSPEPSLNDLSASPTVHCDLMRSPMRSPMMTRCATEDRARNPAASFNPLSASSPLASPLLETAIDAGSGAIRRKHAYLPHAEACIPCRAKAADANHAAVASADNAVEPPPPPHKISRRRGRMLMPRIGGAIALLAIVAASVPDVAQAQRQTNLEHDCPAVTASQARVCNTQEEAGDEAVVGAVGGSGNGRFREVANSFRTGGNPEGYLLREVHIAIDRNLNMAMDDITVAIHHNNGGVPGSQRGARLSGVARPPTGTLQRYTGEIPLAHNAVYFVVVGSTHTDTDSGNANRGYRLEVTTAENQITNDGWELGDRFHRRYVSGSDLDWGPHSNSALHLAVIADINAPKGITKSHADEPLSFTEAAESIHRITYKLNAPPSNPNSNVIVTPRSDPPGVLTFDPAQVTFDSISWDGGQVITAKAVNDDIASVGGQLAATIRHAISGGDGGYNDLDNPAPIAAVISDDDAPGPPLAPADVTATVGNEQVTLDWTVPRDNGSPILRYEICALETFVEADCTGDALTAINDAAATSGVVTGLINGVTYTFAVRAVTAQGAGAFSATATATPDTPLSSCPATAETRETVCNIGQTASSESSDLVEVGPGMGRQPRRVANAFTTGNNAGGYTLRSVRFEIRDVIDTPSVINVYIHNASGGAPASDGVPGGRVGQLSGNARSVGFHEYTGSISLGRGTTYFLVIETRPRHVSHYQLGTTLSPDQTGSTAADWRIGDRVQEQDGEEGVWQPSSAGNVVLRFAVAADAIVPEGVTASVDELTIDESGSDNQAEYTLVLDAQPSADVTVAASAAPAGAVEFSRTAGGPFTPTIEVVFTDENWDEEQTITVTAVDDSIDNLGDQRTVTIRHGITSGDSEYIDLRDLPEIDVVVIDDDPVAAPVPTPPPAPTTPPAPTGVSAMAGDGSITVSWTAGTGVTGQPASEAHDICVILKSTTNFPSNRGECEEDDSVNVPATNATITGLTNGTAYKIAVRSYESNMGALSDWVEASGTHTPTVIVDSALRLKLRVFLESALP